MADYFNPDFTQDFLSSRRNYPDGNTRIGEYGRLWYDSITNTIRIGDNVTPGGIIVSGGGIANNWIKVSTTYTAENGDKIIADTSGGSFTISLPASPEIGSFVSIYGSDLTAHNLTVSGNGQTIEGSGTSLVLSESNVITDFIFDGTTWQAVSSAGGTSGKSGYSGYSGLSGYSGAQGPIGLSGYSGIGSSGYSGISGYSGGGLDPWTRITSNYYAQNGNRLIADTEGGSFTIFLPASPVTGEYIQITDGWDFALNNCFVDPNGGTIEGLTDIVALDLKGVTFEFIYDGTTWEVTGTTGARGQSGYSGIDGGSGYSGYSGSALDNWTKITSNYTAQNNNRLIADTQAGSFTIFLPASPVVGDYIQITDGWDFAINNCFVDPNGGTIEGLTDIVALDLKGVTFEFIYDGATWEVTGTTGARGQSGYSGGGLDPWTKITTNYYAQNGNRLIADTQAGSFTIYLPASPITGDYVQITDGWNFGLINCYVDPNGSTIEGLTDIVILDLTGVTFEFIYDGTTWEVTGTTGARGQSGYSGQPGYGIQIAGVVFDYTFLPASAPAGTLYVILNSGGGYNAGDGAVSDGGSPLSTWTNTGPIQGPPGTSGFSGYSGQQGTSGFSGISGYSGLDGAAAFSGYSGFSGISGYSGLDGAAAFSGYSGESGPPGASGYSGEQGISGFSGYSGSSFSGDYVSTITGGTGVTVTGGTGVGSTPTVEIGQSVAITDNVEFGNVLVGTTGALRFTDDIALAAIHGATIPYAQFSAASRFYTNVDALAGYTIAEMKPGDFYYDDVSASIYICIDTGLGYFDLLDLTVRA